MVDSFVPIGEQVDDAGRTQDRIVGKMGGFCLVPSTRAGEVRVFGRRNQVTSEQLCKHLVGKRLVLGSITPRLWRIDMTQRYERLYRGRELGGGGRVGSESHKNQRWHALASQCYNVVRVGATFIILVQTADVSPKLSVVFLVRDIAGPNLQQVVNGRDP